MGCMSIMLNWQLRLRVDLDRLIVVDDDDCGWMDGRLDDCVSKWRDEIVDYITFKKIIKNQMNFFTFNLFFMREYYKLKGF